MNNKIAEIIEKNAKDLEERKQHTPLAVLKNTISLEKGRDFYSTIQQGYAKKGVGLITEIKLASPTQPHLGNPKDIPKRAKAYADAGADALSFVTEKHFFKGDSKFIQQIKNVVSLPVLQKDFIGDAYQIYEAKKAGADALLFIVKLLDVQKLQEFVQLCLSLGMEPVVEINDEPDLKKAIQTNTKIIAVNARDLDTFQVDVAHACALVQQVPTSFLTLGFSGIQTAEEMRQYTNAGAKGILIGTSLMKTNNIAAYIKELYEHKS